MESTDQVKTPKASDQYTEGILLSTQQVCIVAYCYQVRNVIALLVCYQVRKMGAQLPMLSSCKYAMWLHSYLCCHRIKCASYLHCWCLIKCASGMHSQYLIKCASCMHSYLCCHRVSTQCGCIVGGSSSMQCDCIVTYVIKYASGIHCWCLIKSDSINVRNMLTIYYLCHIFYSVWNDSMLTFELTRCILLFYIRYQGDFWDV